MRIIQPTHPGSMAQIGWNTGPRHATVFGLAKSFNKKLDTATMIADDEDAIAALTLMWGLVQAHMPTDITSHVEQALEESGLPRLATRNVAEGMLHFRLGAAAYFKYSRNWIQN